MKNSVIGQDQVRTKTSLKTLIARLWPYFMRRKLLFFTTVVAVFGVAIAGRLAVTLFGVAIDEGLSKGQESVVLTIAVGYFALEIGRCFMTFLNAFLFSKLGNRVLFEIRDKLVRHVQSLPVSYFEKNPTGRIVTRLTSDVVSLGELFTQGLISVFASIVSLVAIVIAMSAISVKMTLVTLLIAPPLIWIVVEISRRIMIVLRESKAKLAAINAFVAENIGGMRVTQLYGRVARNRERFGELSAAYRVEQLKSVHLYAMLWPATSFFNAASVATALYVGGKLTMSGSVTTGAMVAFILHVRAFIEPLHTILEKYSILQNSLSGAERVFTVLDEAPEDLPAETPAKDQESFKLRGEVEFKGVSFRYGDGLSYAIENIDLTAKPGESVALVGRTGSGKSTMIALLQRFYDPTEGRILIDSQPSTELEKRLLRSRIGVVQQDTFIFRGTIADNISLGDPRISRERIERAAEMACLHEILSRQKGGLDAKVEERGANLSIGERQLIAFARILAFDPDILILDEATSNIDSATEKLIQEATRRVRQGRTSFIVAHRISTIADCDKIALLSAGQIVEMGTHSELYEKGGLYTALCRAQFKDSEKELSLSGL